MRRVAIATAVFALFSSAISAASAQTTTGSQLNPCAVPNEVGASFEEAAWQIFVAATCPVNSDQYPFVVWENWIEQALLYPADPSNGLQVPNSGAPTVTHTLHNSPLTITLSPGLAVTVPGLNGAPDAACNKAAAPPPNQPNLIICEEVRLNGAAENYIAGTDLWNRTARHRRPPTATTSSFRGRRSRPRAIGSCSRVSASTVTIFLPASLRASTSRPSTGIALPWPGCI